MIYGSVDTMSLESKLTSTVPTLVYTLYTLMLHVVVMVSLLVVG